mgnify:CR=1 FL=1
MSMISIRVDPSTKSLAEASAAAADQPLSEWIRSAIEAALGLDADRDKRAPIAPRTLSRTDRLNLVMMYRLFQHLEVDDYPEGWERMVEVFEHGFTGEYDEAFVQLYDELPIDECRLLWDLLDMFRILEASTAELDEGDIAELGEQTVRRLGFRGFDFNDSREGALADYARHLVLKKGRWTELAERFDDKHERGNSHMPMLATYLRMLDAFNPIWKAHMSEPGIPALLGVDDLQAIAEAMTHPSQRGTNA